MEYFLETSGTIEDGKGFSAFGTVHLIWLVITVAAVLFGCIFWRKLQGKALQRWKIIMAALIIANELFKTVCLFAGGNYTVGYLPLHLCSINIFIIAFHAFHPTRTLDNFLYIICIPGAIAALLFPTWTELPVLNFMHLHSFTFHILLILYPAVLTACGAIRPNIRNIPGSLLLLVAFVAVICIVNANLGTNFMFLAEGPAGTPLAWFQENWGSHLYGFPVILAALIAVLYLPWEVKRLLTKAR